MNAKLTLGARVLLSIIFLFLGGLNGFFHFMAMPAPPPAAGAFFGAMYATGFFLPLLFSTQIVAGVLLLTNRFTPLALVILAPIVVQILAFHAFLDPAGMGIALVVLALELFLAYQYRAAFHGILKANVQPATFGEKVSPVTQAA